MHSIPLLSPAPRAILRCASALRCIALRSPIHRFLAPRSIDSSIGVIARAATRPALRTGLVLHALLAGVLAAQSPPPNTPRRVARHDSAAAAVTPACHALHPLAHGSPVVPASAVAGAASFVDPSAHVVAPHRIALGCRSFVAPFVLLDASAGRITIGHESDLQDNVTVRGGGVAIGDRVIVAHGATVVGPAWLGASHGAPAFVGFNAYIDRATVEPDAFVGHLARVGPGVVIHSGVKVLTGKYVRTQAEADDSTLGKVVALTDADRDFMREVLHVNTTLAAGYAALYHAAPTEVHGAGRDPGHSDFNHDADLPRFAGLAESHPEHDRVRIIGAVSLGDGYRAFLARSGRNVAIRADEGEHFSLGRGARLRDRVTLHALEHTDLEIGVRDDFGVHVVVHGGADDAVEPRAITRVGNDVRVKDWAVVFRSKVGDGCTIGRKAYVDGSHLRPGTVVPDRAILVKDRIIGYVEW